MGSVQRLVHDVRVTLDGLVKLSRVPIEERVVTHEEVRVRPGLLEVVTLRFVTPGILVPL